VGSHHSGGSLALLSLLAQFWGAAERDLYSIPLRWEDIGTDVLPWHAFVSMMLNAPPGSAVYHQITEGWDVLERLTALLLDTQRTALWTKSKDAHAKPPRNRPKPTWQPGMPEEAPEDKEYQAMTIEQYMEKAGLT
jgi:hypothetical protein